MEKLFTVSGSIRQDGFGRIVIDPCESDAEHLRSAPTNPATNKPSCRHLAETAFADFIGRRGTLVVAIRLQEEGAGCVPEAEMEVHNAETRKVSLRAISRLEQAVHEELERINAK